MDTLITKMRKVLEVKGYEFSKTTGLENEEDIIRLVEELINENNRRKEDIKNLEKITFNLGVVVTDVNKRVQKTGKFVDLCSSHVDEGAIKRSVKMSNWYFETSRQIDEIHNGESPAAKRQQANINTIESVVYTVAYMLRKLGLAYFRRTPGTDDERKYFNKEDLL